MSAGSGHGVSTPKSGLSSTFAARHSAALVANLAADAPIYQAHVGAGVVAPSGSLAAMRAAVDGGASVIELDLRRLGDGTLVNMHDETVDATTTGTGNVADQTWASWVKLTYDGSDEKLVTVEAYLREFGNKVTICAQTYAEGTVEELARLCDQLGVDKAAVIVQTNNTTWSTAAHAAGFPVMYLAGNTAVDWATYLPIFDPAWVNVADDGGVDQTLVDLLHDTYGVKVMVYTINSQWRRDQLLALGVDGINTDDPAYLSNNYLPRQADLFAAQALTPGQRVLQGSAPVFSTADYLEWEAGGSGSGRRVSLGYMESAATDVTASFKVTEVNDGAAPTVNGLYFYLLMLDEWGADAPTASGYVFFVRADGALQIRKVSNGTSFSSLSSVVAQADWVLGTEYTYTAAVSGTTVSVQRDDVPGTAVTVTNSEFRPAKWRVGVECIGAASGVKIRDITIT